MGDRLEDLRDAKRKLDEAAADVGRELKRAKQRERDKRKKDAKAWVLSSVERNTALIIYSLTNYTAKPAARFLMVCGQKHRWPEKLEQELEVLADDLFLQVSPEDLADLSHMEDSTDPAAMKSALVFAEEWKLAQWTADLNAQHGVAPSTESVLQRYEEQRLAIPEAVRPRSRGTAHDVAARVWAVAWRRRWGGKHGRIRVQEDIPVEDLRSKASS